MIYVNIDSTDAVRCLAAEYYFATERILEDDVLMLWTTVPTVVVGRFQNIYEEVDMGYLKERGIRLVRRLSGGGTIYNDFGGYMFSFVGRGGDEIEFDRYMIPVVEAIRELGVPAERDGRNDIMAHGRKLSGNAQYKAAGRTVHHGTLMFSVDVCEMERATRLPEYKISSKGIRSVRDRVVNISEITDKISSAEEFSMFLREKLAGEAEYFLTDEDKARIDEIMVEKFEDVLADPAKSSPAFDFESSCSTPGGHLTLRLSVKRGVIQSAHLDGDYFSHTGTESLTDALVGCAFRGDDIKAAIKKSGINVMGADTEALAAELCRGI